MDPDLTEDEDEKSKIWIFQIVNTNV
jgi:hypothetical protein